MEAMFFQNSPLVQLYSSDSNIRGVGNIPGNHFVNAFSVLSCILNYGSRITEVLSLQC